MPALATLAALLAAIPAVAADTAADWPAYGRDAGGSRYSPLAQITRENVARLAVAWTYRTGELENARKAPWRNATFETTPILADGTLYFCTTFARVVALDPESGAERWTFDPGVDRTAPRADLACRGVSTWRDPERGPDAPCARRILHGTVDGGLFALDARAGRPCADFGAGGHVALTTGVGNWAPGFYGVTSPPAVVGDAVIVGSAIGDNRRADEARGVVRAFDARTGMLRWSWDPIPRGPDDPAWSTWENGSAARTGAANAWSIPSADPERDLVFVPTGSASPDFYGGERPGPNLYANSVVALRASTGERVWHFQTVHHDLGLRRARAADPGHGAARRRRGARRGAGDEDGLPVRARPPHRPAALSGRGAARAPGRRGRRAAVADAAVPARAAAAGAAAPHG